MRVLVTGSSGFIGSAICQSLVDGGHQVVRAVRANSRGDHAPPAGAVLWDPRGGFAEPTVLEGLDAVIHLAGENVWGIWTAAKRREILDSRVVGTGTLCESLAAAADKPRTLIVASAVGYYGDRGAEPMDEDSYGGDGFLAMVAGDTEAATHPARAAGIRTISARLGLVLGAGGGALSKILPAFRSGLGSRLGSGRQYLSWIAMPDLVRAMEHLLVGPGAALRGPVNLVTPNPVTNAQFTQTLGSLLHRPTPFSMPTLLLRLVLGRVADEVLLSSVRAVPRRLVESGFHFRCPDLASALRQVLRLESSPQPVGVDE